MKEGWEYSTIGKLCKTYSGGTPLKNVKEYYQDGNIPWLRSGEVCQKYIYETEMFITQKGLESSSAKYYPINTVVVAMYGATAAQVGILKIEATSNQAVCGIIPNSKFLPEFLYYFFCYRKEFLASQAQGGAQPNISQVKIKNLEVPVPSFSEQQSIVDYLDSAFAKIDAMKANAEKRLNEAQALFQASLKKMLEPKEGWEEKILQDICSDIVDCPHTTPKKVGFPTQYPCIRTSELRGGSIDWSTMQYLDEDEYKKRVSRLVPKANDLVYGREGTYGDAVLLPDGYSFSLGQRTMLLRANEIYIIPRFLLYSMISPHVYQQAKEKNSGCGVGHVNVKDIKVFRVGLPTIDTQQSIVETLDSLKSKVDRLQENYEKISQECDALKQAILRQVFE